MRAWLYDQLTQHEPLWPLMTPGVANAVEMADRVTPRRAQLTISLPRPFIIYGLGHESNEGLSDDPDFEQSRQFFQIWVHDDGPTYLFIDEIIPVIRKLFRGANSPADNITEILWLETSQEFNNETYNTVFRYLRFQAIKSRQGVLTP